MTRRSKEVHAMVLPQNEEHFVPHSRLGLRVRCAHVLEDPLCHILGFVRGMVEAQPRFDHARGVRERQQCQTPLDVHFIFMCVQLSSSDFFPATL